MEIYYIIYIFLLLFTLKEVFLTKNSKLVFVLFTVFFILFVGLRKDVGNDYSTYLENYLLINSGLEGSATEYLYVLTNLIFSFDVFIFFISLFSFYYLHKAIAYFNKDYPITSYFIYFGIFLITYNIHILRQGISIAMVFYGYKYLYEKKRIEFILFVILAFTFHKSALIVLPFTFLININLTVKRQIILLVIATVVYLLSNVFVDLFYIIAANTPILSSYLAFYRREEFTATGITLGMLMDMVIMIALLLKFKNLEGKDLFMYRLFFISVILSLLLSFMPAGIRLNYYFRTSLIFILPLLFRLYNLKKITIASLVFITYYYLYVTFNGQTEYGRGDRNLEYKTIFDEQ